MPEIRLIVDAAHAEVSDALRGDLRRHARIDVRQVPAVAGDDSKSGTGLALVEMLVDGVPAAVVGAVATVVTAFVARRGARKIVLKSGNDEVTIVGADAEAQKVALEQWLRDHGTDS